MKVRVVVELLAALVLCGCGRSTEQKLIGTWSYSGMDWTNYYDLHADHSVRVMSPLDDTGAERPLVLGDGTWRLDGDRLLIEWALYKDASGQTRYPPRTEKGRIKELTSEKLVMDDGSNYHREKPLKPYPPSLACHFI
jgi:hypothetical protein